MGFDPLTATLIASTVIAAGTSFMSQSSKPSMPAAPPPVPEVPEAPESNDAQLAAAKEEEKKKLQQRASFYQSIQSTPGGVEESAPLGRTILTGSMLKSKLG